MTILQALTIRMVAMVSIITVLIISNIASAEEIQVPLGQQGDKENPIERPSSGMTKDQVQARFGEPSSLKEAIGEPPISSWRYNSFTVYFEYNRVIHSVLDHKAI